MSVATEHLRQLIKAKKYNVGEISQKTGMKKVAPGKWVKVGNNKQYKVKSSESKVNKLTDSHEKILGTSLYIINKYAKKIRDKRNDIKDYLFNQEENDETIHHPYSDRPIFDRSKIEDEIEDAERERDYAESRIYYIEKKLGKDIDDEAKEKLEKELKGQEEDYGWQDGLVDEFNGILESYDNKHEELRTLLDEQNELYSLKDKVIKKLGLKPIEYHDFGVRTGKTTYNYETEDEITDTTKIIRPMYKIGNFSFHGNPVDEDFIEENNIKVSESIDEEISSEIKLDEKDILSKEKAIEIVDKFLSSGKIMKANIDKFLFYTDSQKNLSWLINK